MTSSAFSIHSFVMNIKNYEQFPTVAPVGNNEPDSNSLFMLIVWAKMKFRAEDGMIFGKSLRILCLMCQHEWKRSLTNCMCTRTLIAKTSTD